MEAGAAQPQTQQQLAAVQGRAKSEPANSPTRPQGGAAPNQKEKREEKGGDNGSLRGLSPFREELLEELGKKGAI